MDGDQTYDNGSTAMATTTADYYPTDTGTAAMPTTNADYNYYPNNDFFNYDNNPFPTETTSSHIAIHGGYSAPVVVYTRPIIKYGIGGIISLFIFLAVVGFIIWVLVGRSR